MTYEHMADAAFAANIPPGFAIAGGYYGGPNAYHTWLPEDWRRFPGCRLPIWVGGQDGPREGAQAVATLKALGVPPGCVAVLDMEARKDIEYVNNFGAELLHNGGYKTWVYGSASTVYGNPPLNGYWVADYGLTAGQLMAVLEVPHVRAIQYASFPAFDASLVKAWTEGEMWHG